MSARPSIHSRPSVCAPGLALILLLVACGASPRSTASGDRSAGLTEHGRRLLRDSLDAMVMAGTIPGAVHLVMIDGRVAEVVTAGYSDVEARRPIQRNSIFRLASATKIWVSVALLTLVDDGRVALDDPVSQYLPEFRDQRVLAGDSTRLATADVTVRDLLRHTAGIGYGSPGPYQQALLRAGLMRTGGRFARDWTHAWDLSEWTARLAQIPLLAEPGTRFDYGLSHDVLGRLIEVVSGEPLPVFVKRAVLDPLRLTDTGFDIPGSSAARLTSFYEIQGERLVRVESADESAFLRSPRAPSGGGGWDQPGNGGMVSTVDDFARFLEMLRLGGTLDDVRILREETVRTMLSNQLADIGDGNSYWPGVGFGFGHAVLYDTARYDGVGGPGKIWWAGSTNVYFWIDPELRLTGVFMTHLVPFGHADVMDRAERLTYEALAIGDTAR